MIPEIGHYALILALCMAIVQSTLPLIGAARRIPSWTALARPTAIGQLIFVFISYLCLTYGFIVSDFSVAYVVKNSNTALPLLYKISGVWGAHEGSLLLWALILASWTGAVALFSRNVPRAVIARVIAVMGLVSIGFLLFLLLTSNPFERLFPIPLEGRDLNPLLQDVGLAIHPPMLYMGYVGFSVAFAFAIAALIGGHLDTAWARWARPWTNIAWCALTIGIALGSWWAYYELGWGGWWFWDPVENASFMPWLVGTALIHSLAATEKRGAFKSWTILLAVTAFSLSLLGTFLVRSGVLTSVHAFATDPARGLFILVFLGIVVGGSLLLYAFRAPMIRSTGTFEPVSRETALLVNNVLLVCATAVVLFGTLAPLVYDALSLPKISVGPPYFNMLFIPVTAPLAILAGIGALTRWKQDRLGKIMKPLYPLLAISIVLSVLATLTFDHFSFAAAFGIFLGLWVTLTTFYGLYSRVAGRKSKLLSLTHIPAGFYGMSMAHLGIAVFAVGVSLTSVYSIEKDVRLSPNETFALGGYTFHFNGVRNFQGPNYIAKEGTIVVSKGETNITTLSPQKRTYLVQQNPMTEAAIDPGLTRDIYVALGEPLGDDGSWSVRLYHKPFIRWIWLGAIFMALGGFLAILDKRYRLARRRQTVTNKDSINVSVGATS